MKGVKKWILNFLILILFVIAFFCGFKIYRHYAGEIKESENFRKISASVECSDEKDLLKKYNELHMQNPDMIGWIKIDGTTVNYPVMHTPDSPDYYLRKNFDKQYSVWGVPYVQGNCSLIESDNIIIHGHHIRGEKMFGALKNYTSKEFFEEHDIIEFNTLTQIGKYRIIAVFKTAADNNGYRYYDYTGDEDEIAFDNYVAKCKALSLYDIQDSANYGDKLITLSTCEYSVDNGRLVVVAKKIS